MTLKVKLDRDEKVEFSMVPTGECFLDSENKPCLKLTNKKEFKVNAFSFFTGEPYWHDPVEKVEYFLSEIVERSC